MPPAPHPVLQVGHYQPLAAQPPSLAPVNLGYTSRSMLLVQALHFSTNFGVKRAAF